MREDKKNLLKEKLASGEEKVLIDNEIIKELREKIKTTKEGLCCYKKILLIKDMCGPHILSVKQFGSLHVLIAIIYSISNNNSNIIIYGGGNIKIETNVNTEKITIYECSTSFGGMNLNEIQTVISKIDIPIEVDAKYMSTKMKETEYSLAELEQIESEIK